MTLMPGCVCVLSIDRGSDSGLYQTPPVPRGMANDGYSGSGGGYTSEDQLSLTLPPGRESDQLSVSSSSSIGGPSPRDRRCLPSDASGIYLPMAPLSSSLHSPASSSKVSVSDFIRFSVTDGLSNFRDFIFLSRLTTVSNLFTSEKYIFDDS